ncbi:hypothetical protein [Oceanospirillum maris]|uniref:hypothetical protein n=1 Tax=Oceanospirillum maris TaxID=64977 RepID=UPI000406DE27|nr:hypothetical protein [Oceanospirillum maris]
MTHQSVFSSARGLRNKNPFNIKKTGINWQGETDGGDATFETFSSHEMGIRAGARLLLNYEQKHGLNTVSQIISRFAPGTENNTGAYIEHVSDQLNVHPDEPFSVRGRLVDLTKAIIRHENGINPFSDQFIADSVALA